jgi:hypothetical protein
MELLADWMKQAIDARNNDSKLSIIHAEVTDFATQFPLPSGKQKNSPMTTNWKNDILAD